MKKSIKEIARFVGGKAIGDEARSYTADSIDEEHCTDLPACTCGLAFCFREGL